MHLSYSGYDNLPYIAQRIFKFAGDRKIWALDGEMAAGKTTLVREICRQLDVISKISSPTYPLVNEYITNAGIPVYHFDFYRIKKIEEAWDIGFREYLDSGYFCLIEWPSRVEDILPSETLRLVLHTGKHGSRELDMYHKKPTDYPIHPPR